MEKDYLKLLDQLIEGKISKSDRHVLEKQALDDPFLSDALEGIELYQKSKERPVFDLSQFDSQRKDARIIRLPVRLKYALAMAASLVLIFFVFQLMEEAPSPRTTTAVELSPVINESPNRETSFSEEEKSDATGDSESSGDQNPRVGAINQIIQSESPVETKFSEGSSVGETSQSALSTSSTELSPDRPNEDKEDALVLEDDKEPPGNSQEKTRTLALKTNVTSDKISEGVAETALAPKVNKIFDAKQEEPMPAASIRSQRENVIKPSSIKIDGYYPLIGHDELKRRADQLTLTKEYLFMRNLKLPVEVEVSFIIAEDGSIQITAPIQSELPLHQKMAVDLIMNSGKWVAPSPNYKASYIVVFRKTG